MIPIRDIVKRLLPASIRGRLRKTFELSQLAYADVRINMLGDLFPLKPRSISFMANDICNSRCEMCLIWERKKDHEITPDELRQVLAEPLFSKVQDIGITGGEPTLRKDLSELFRVIAEKKPKVRGVSMITNAIRESEVQQRVMEGAEICQSHGIGFSVMVSLDGVGEVHDTVRGRQGNFENVIACIEAFRTAGIPVSFGATVTTSNAPFIDDLLDYAQEHNLYGRFRVAEFIDRLYNAPQSNVIRNFDAVTQYHLGLFFFRVRFEYEKDPMIQKTYASIRGMLVEGKPRTAGCPYHHSAVILTSRGELLYCSPKSPNLGSVLTPGTATNIFFSNLSKRADLKKRHCDDCIHDYHVPETFREKAAFYFRHRRIHQTYNCNDLVRRTRRILQQRPGHINPLNLESERVLIVGWYGTETTGDKAILWGIINRLRNRSRPPKEIYLSSLYPFICEWTKHEMNLPELKIVETYGPEFEQACEMIDEVLVGGGPLMDLESLNHMLYAFAAAKRRGKIVRVEGCGIGPLNNPIYINVVREMMRLSDHIGLRDQASTKRCRDEFGEPAECVIDPAHDYLVSLLNDPARPLKSSGVANSQSVSFFLREWPAVYAADLEQDEFCKTNVRFNNQIEQLQLYLTQQRGLQINLLPMHTFAEGGDDRVLNRRLARRLREKYGVPANQVFVQRLPISPLETCQAMANSLFNVCMRYHSVFFAETLGTEYLAIDYTGGGKIRGFLEDCGKLDRLLTLQEVASGHWREKVDCLLSRVVGKPSTAL